MLASSPFLLVLGRPCPISIYPHSMCVHAKTKTRTRNKQWKEKMQRVYERSIKKISMIDMASKETRKQANKSEGKQARKQTTGGVHEGPM